jgi:hypothetical protein
MTKFDDFHYPDLIKLAYDAHKISYTIYRSNNKFDGTPIPEGYKAVYIDDGIVPPSLLLKKLE